MYRSLDVDRIVSTVETLELRIRERFPGSGLSRVCAELLGVARESRLRLDRMARPYWPVRIAVGAVIAALAAVLVGLALQLRVSPRVDRVSELLQAMEAGINDVVFFGIAIFFLATLEARLKRRAALRALHELRSLAHVVDMHQLTKDPDRLLSPASDTRSSPARAMTPVDLARYLDYCSELLSHVSKLAALHAQRFPDPVVHGAVNDVETLADGLSAKIWQKIMILDVIMARDPRPAEAVSARPSPGT